ncbi:hypothetical protein ACGF3K_14595 [Streptomyces sp. NPDC047980]|uniref:hypothetical protein n=1 Tax=Streptomyces sp. NPDC047980 TaxID=3365494 RepID=UPI00372350CB
MSSPLPVVEFPDAEQVIPAYLRGKLPSGTLVGTEWPANLESKLAAGVVAVTRGGGAVQLAFVTEDVTLDIDILAASKKQAHTLAQQVRGWLFAAPGEATPGAQVYRVRDVSLIWLPHQPSAETDPIPRYVLVMELRIRPA